jgi:hypothetical protein
MGRNGQRRRLRQARCWSKRFTKTVKEYGVNGRPKSHPPMKGDRMADDMVRCPLCEREVKKKGLAKHAVVKHVRGSRCDVGECPLAAVAMTPNGTLLCSQHEHGDTEAATQDQ